ncbi:hypothetical protein BIU99_17865 [Plantibacter sp. MMLR14_011]|nr:hypothetical protein BIU99_17865 [Plantibacter sp. MMLR14_011]
MQTGLKGRRLTESTVDAWQEVVVEAKDGAFTAMGKAAAGVALPGRFGKAASAAVGAAFESKRPDHQVRVDWLDGKRSLLKLPDALFTHLELVLRDKRIPTVVPTVSATSEATTTTPTLADRAFDLVSGIVKDRSSSSTHEPQELTSTPEMRSDAVEQLHKLASLRDAGILTDEEFAQKKAELLARL